MQIFKGRSSERGAILIHVALLLLGVVALSAFVLDYGIMWASRGQAQNSADAGALAGATALVLDDPTWPIPSGGVVENSAKNAAQYNGVWAGTPGVTVTGTTCPSGLSVTSDCIRV